jgi:hypothetical protein
MIALCDYVARYKARRAAQTPDVEKEKHPADLTAEARSDETIQAAASRDFHEGGLLVSDL